MKTRAKLLNVSIIGVCFAVAFGVFITAQTPAPRPAQQPAAAQTQVVVNVNETGPWSYIGSDAAQTRYSPLNQINASNFQNLVPKHGLSATRASAP